MDERGPASVELLGVLPALLLAGLVAWQLVLAGQAVWLAGNAARVAARAAAVGDRPARAARSALPAGLRRGMLVAERDGRVTVQVRMPVLMRGWGSPVRLEARAGLPRQ
jgi:pilus assembly protein CpaE